MNTRMKELRNFYPEAKNEDWELINAGIRVQAIKKEDGDAGIVHFGTEVLSSSDKSISALLGASPGASVSVNIILQIIRENFAHLLQTKEAVIVWRTLFLPTMKNLSILLCRNVKLP